MQPPRKKINSQGAVELHLAFDVATSFSRLISPNTVLTNQHNKLLGANHPHLFCDPLLIIEYEKTLSWLIIPSSLTVSVSCFKRGREAQLCKHNHPLQHCHRGEAGEYLTF